MGFDFEIEPYEKLAPEWVELYNEKSKISRLQAGAPEALRLFEKKGITQILLSATELEMLRGQIDELGIAPYFSEVMGLGNIHAYSKRELAMRWRERNPDAVPIVIGDTTHDAEVATAIGADCVLVSNGHQSAGTLRGTGFEVFADLSSAVIRIE